MNRNCLFAILLPATIFLAGCNNDDCDASFSCDTVQPTYGTLTIRVSTNTENPRIPIAVYKGYIEDSALYFVDTISQSTDYYVDLDQRYSGSATYRDGGNRIIAIDGDRVNLTTENNCDYTCYKVQDGTLQLSLK